MCNIRLCFSLAQPADPQAETEKSFPFMGLFAYLNFAQVIISPTAFQTLATGEKLYKCKCFNVFTLKLSSVINAQTHIH